MFVHVTILCSLTYKTVMLSFHHYRNKWQSVTSDFKRQWYTKSIAQKIYQNLFNKKKRTLTTAGRRNAKSCDEQTIGHSRGWCSDLSLYNLQRKWLSEKFVNTPTRTKCCFVNKCSSCQLPTRDLSVLNNKCVYHWWHRRI